jgi:eukaryotic-like serine/threonine-protein kinase
MVMGTAMYVSPEQATGAPVTAASDIYSLGVVAYECLAGHVPFWANEPLAIAYAHKHAPVPPLPPDVPQPVADLVYDMLAKTPDRRPASVRVVADRADMLRDALALGGVPVGADPLGLTRGDLPAAGTGYLTGGEGFPPGRAMGGERRTVSNRRRVVTASLTATLCALAAAAGLYLSGHIGNHPGRDAGNTVGQISSPTLSPSQVTTSAPTPSASPSTVVQQPTTSPPTTGSPRPTKTTKPKPSPTPSPTSASPSPSPSPSSSSPTTSPPTTSPPTTSPPTTSPPTG